MAEGEAGGGGRGTGDSDAGNTSAAWSRTLLVPSLVSSCPFSFTPFWCRVMRLNFPTEIDHEMPILF